MRFEVDPMQPADWEAVAAIYQEGLATGQATFETQVPSWKSWDSSHLTQTRLVARRDDEVLGWAALSPVSDRCAYQGVAEVSVYVSSAARGQGVGKALLNQLIEESEKAGIWTLQAGIFPENEASIGLHHSCGFRMVGVRERLGKLNGRWRDVAMLERRSPSVGTC
ncbi:MAG TPA: GNAT family N-acetyltransferase [Acidobacteriota bacterium]|nr:GNAT family N-acetyltransferase [Acidobacteriota bacterium]